MKALLASTLTALVLVTAAWASNVTPAQFSALSKRVTKLEQANKVLAARVTADEAYSDKCFASFAPVKSYTVTLHHSDGSPDDVFGAWTAPAVGDKPDFWVPLTRDSSCFKP